MKLLCICDRTINKDVLPALQELYDMKIDIDIYFNPLLNTQDEVMKCMHVTEAEGPEGYPIPEELYSRVEDVDIILVHVTPITKRLIDSAKKLKMVAVMRGGCNNVDVKYLLEKGIIVSNASWRSANAVADFTLGMILAEMKNIARSYAGMKNGKWIKTYRNQKNIHDLKTCKVGILGFGNIGQRVAQRLKGFESEIIVHDPFLEDETIEQMGYHSVSKEELFREADIVTIHLRQSEATIGIVGGRELAWMKSSAILVNTARAKLVDEEALVEALRENRIQGAALDVYYEEPLPKDHPFLELENVTLTSHIAGVSADTKYNSFMITKNDIQNYLDGKGLQCPVRG